MVEEYTYWFVRVKEVDSDVVYGEQIEDHQFKVIGDREVAKKYCIERFGNFPFKKPKTSPKGTKYFYLMPSDLYWYEKHYREFQCVCTYCQKEYIRIGETPKSKMFNVNGKDICSIECNIFYRQKLKDEYASIENQNYWVSDSKHPLTSKTKTLVGYIYRITNKVNMVSYVGKTIKPPLFRWWQHLDVDKKFEQEDLSELVFEVLEIVYWDDELLDKIRFKNGNEKLSSRERYYIDLYDLVEQGFNKI